MTYVPYTLSQQGGLYTVTAPAWTPAQEGGLVGWWKADNPGTQVYTNLATNPSFETDTANCGVTGSGLNAGATLTRVTTQHQVGAASGQLAMTGALQGMVQTIGAVTGGALYTASVYVKGNAGGEPVQIQLGDTANSDHGTAVGLTATTSFVQYTCTWTPTSSHASAQLIIQQQNVTGTFTVFVDAILIIAGSSTTYFDGSSAGGAWLGTTNDSASTLSQAASNGGQITVWTDSSGNGRTMTAGAIPPLYQTNQQNGLPGVQFSGDASGNCEMFTGALGLTSQPVTVVAVLKETGGNRYAGFNTDPRFGGGSNAQIFAGGSITGGAITSFCCVSATANGAGSVIRINGAVSATGNPGTNAPGAGVGFYVGNDGAPINQPWGGVILEVMLFSSAPTTANFANLEGYLGVRYALGFGTQPQPVTATVVYQSDDPRLAQSALEQLNLQQAINPLVGIPAAAPIIHPHYAVRTR